MSSSSSLASRPRNTAATRLRAARYAVVLAALAGAVVMAFLATLAWGSVSIPVPEVVAILRGDAPPRASWAVIVWDLRMPRAVTAVLAGVAMALAGLAMQTLFRNALAEPYVLGVTAGAGLGVGLVLLPQAATLGVGATLVAATAPLQAIGVVGAAAAGAFAVLLLMSALAARVQNLVIVLVAGVMVGAFLAALTNVLIYFAQPEAVVAFTQWQFGSFQAVRGSQLLVLAIGVGIGVALLVSVTNPLNVALLGERYAQSMGVSPRRVRMIAIAATALLAGTVTAYTGPIAFLGIAAPHLARGLLGTSDHRLLIPGAALVGAVIALWAGFFAQLPGADVTLPLNAALALIGAPIVIQVLLRIHRTGGGFSA